MRKVFVAFVAVVQLAIVGCHHNTCRNGCGNGCRACGDPHALNIGGPARVPRLPVGYMHEQMDGPPGPATASYSYPYYTLRAPRDFLLNNPPSIGP